MTPPGRRSISQYGVVVPFGPHQRFKGSGSVQALKTSSRGASKTRVMTRSRPGPASPTFTTLVIPPLQLLQIVIQTVEALLPKTAIVLNPVGDLPQGSSLQPAWPRLCHASP